MAQPGNPPTAAAGRASRAMWLPALLGAALALAFLTWTAILWYRYHTHIPWRDIYLIVRQVKPLFEPGNAVWDIPGWFDLHYNAHRIFVLRALVAADLLWLGGQNHLLYTVGWLCLLGPPLVFACAIRARQWPEKASALLAVALVALYIFSPSHLWNILNPVNVSWQLTTAMALAGFSLLLFLPGAPRWPAWTGACLLASVAAFSTFAGVIAWLMLPLLALYLRSRYLIPVAVVAVLATYFYSRGITSDAAVLATWSSGPEEAIAHIHAQGREALAGNTPWQIAQKSIAFLGWPLGREHPRFAALLAAASLLPLAWAAWTAARCWWLRKSRPDGLFELALFSAIFCLGIALATQFGRIIPQEVHVQGPSQERFQGVVLLYWACISLLLLSAGTRLAAGLRLAASFGLLGLAVLVTLPWGSYLKEEVLSMEYASRLHSQGEGGHSATGLDKKSLAFRPERIFTLDEFLAEQRLAYRAPRDLQAGKQTRKPCDAGTVPAPGGGQLLQLRIGGLPGLLANEVLLIDGDDSLLRLYPVHSGDYTALELLATDYLEWRGEIPPSLQERRNLLAVVHLPGGFLPACRLDLVPAGE